MLKLPFVKTFVRGLRYAITGFFFTLLITGVNAAPTVLQQILNVKVDITPAKVWGLEVQKVEGTIPVRVLTDAAGRIEGVQFGDTTTQLRYAWKDGSHTRRAFPHMSIPLSTLNKGKMEFSAGMALGTLFLFSVDGRSFSAQTGGVLKINYMKSPMLPANEVSLIIKKINNRWTASVMDHRSGLQRPVESATIRNSSGFFGASLEQPEFLYLDTNRISSALASEPIADPRVAESRLKTSGETLETAAARGTSIMPPDERDIFVSVTGR